jgi:hypothetical protein
LSARSTTETCRPELPSDRRNRIGQKTFLKKEGKIHTHKKRIRERETPERDTEGSLSLEGDA